MLKKLKSLFIIEEEGSAGKEAVKEEKAVPKETKTTSNPSASVPTQAADPGKVTTKFMEVLLTAMDKHNLDGFDYLEFKQSLQSLSKMPMDEKTRFQSAYAMAQTMGATPDKLVQAAQHYLQVLQKEEQKFQAALLNQRSKQIGGKEQQIKQMDLLVKEKTKQILKLNKEIEEHKKQRDQMAKEISHSVVKVESTKNNFVASYNALIAQIGQDVEKIKNYLK